MSSHSRRSIPLVLVLLSAACSAPPPPPAAPAAPPAPPAITQAAVDQSVQDVIAALNAGDAAKAGAAYKADAVLVSARGKVDTSAGIEKFWAGALKAPGAGKDLKLSVERWGTSGDLAWTLSRFTGGITAPSGYVLGVAERQADGSLKTVAQVSIPDPTAK